MAWGVRWYLVGSIVLGVLGVLAGCSGSMFFAEREPWRHDAELQCLATGMVKEGAGITRMQPIRGPGVCGADFPLKVSILGESAPLGYMDDLRPPGDIRMIRCARRKVVRALPINPSRLALPASPRGRMSQRSRTIFAGPMALHLLPFLQNIHHRPQLVRGARIFRPSPTTADPSWMRPPHCATEQALSPAARCASRARSPRPPPRARPWRRWVPRATARDRSRPSA